MRDYDVVLEQLERIIHKYSQKESVKKSYGNDVELTQTEIHLISVIGSKPGISMKDLAAAKGVTPGATSQMIKKMIGKGLVEKRISKESEAKIELFLTKTGNECFSSHQSHHKKANQKWYDMFDKLDDNTYMAVKNLIAEAEDKIDK